jgi:hypothetical protein
MGAGGRGGEVGMLVKLPGGCLGVGLCLCSWPPLFVFGRLWCELGAHTNKGIAIYSMLWCELRAGH